ncbi:transcription initiation factor TFIID subunit 8-like [Saccoglossus kowalevskii]|uniref:Transcription initiation factor TFIID subunit 8 n=1 Tax=Saccoglossus kowalevskii TaxID=10224 RepID=A0ABM0GLP2_SACKO|nr:PREDICTED: transcription initiation factor TFIID subunit 8-like [Saccoglossus kowalevskii]
MTSTGNSSLCAARRKAVSTCVAALCCDVGFHEADKIALETLTEMIQSYITELGRSAQTYCELSGRTEPMLNDVAVSLIEMGTDLAALTMHAKKSQRVLIQPQEQMRPPVTPRILQAGEKKPHPSHIPDYLPSFPDPHTYIKTPSYRRPETEYQAIREQAASQRRDVERALTRFVAKTGETHTLFPDDSSMFPLIACTPPIVPYLDALLPPEHESDSMDDDPSEQTDSDKQTDSQDNDTQDEKENKEDNNSQNNVDGSQSSSQQNTERTEAVIDNPYLRPVKKPKVRRKLK